MWTVARTLENEVVLNKIIEQMYKLPVGVVLTAHGHMPLAEPNYLLNWYLQPIGMCSLLNNNIDMDSLNKRRGVKR